MSGPSAPLRLADGALQAELLPGANMLCCSLCDGGQELLAQRQGTAAYAQSGRTMGIPLLYPWANRLGAASYCAAGREVHLSPAGGLVAADDNGLPIHGVVGGRLAWRAARESEATVRARLEWGPALGEAFSVFPFEHEVSYTAALGDGRLTVKVAVTAGAGEVPVSFGFHPYLQLPGAGREGLLVSLPAMRSLRLDERQIPCGRGAELPAETFTLGTREFDDGFCELRDGAVFALQGAGRRVELELRSGYGFAQVYAPGGSQFVCFEPMTAPADALRSGEGLRVLAPGERHEASFAVSVRAV